ncbi:hypothetical protein PHET_12028 [Paragonimus heterotremus]|uniref:Uncharacterized protein n=1 Tax=Paragonimus heterotremus TaxID=100268 RepID=A0A8J4SN16_9TREM|nr:hypothetical protein PHET_12028 [Paragonimus heterotremus]
MLSDLVVYELYAELLSTFFWLIRPAGELTALTTHVAPHTSLRGLPVRSRLRRLARERFIIAWAESKHELQFAAVRPSSTT